MSESEKIKNPLPTRFEKVKQKQDLLQQGIVLRPEDQAEASDIANAAQSIVTGPVLKKVMDNWKELELKLNPSTFHRGFALLYYRKVFSLEQAAWDEVCQQVVSDDSLDLNKLTPFQAAVLTLQSLGFEKAAASSRELFVELAMHAEQYEHLLKNELGETFTYDKLYELIREHFPHFLKRMIALDSVIIDLYRLNAPEQDRDANAPVQYAGSKLNERFYQLGDNLTFQIKPEFIERLKEWALDKKITEDALGRTENRGCPFLLAEDRDEFINFAIDEFIEQHEKVFGENRD